MPIHESQQRPESPLISIIVVVFEDRDELKRLLDHLNTFRCKEVELVVIDGGSRDGSAELLEDNSHRIDYWASEPDKGIYDAMNKGLQAARGEFVLHINAGDTLRALPIQKLYALCKTEADVVCCRVLEDDFHVFVPRNDWLLRFDNTWHHQGTFYRRSKHLGYETSYRVFGDFDHNQRLRKAGCRVVLLDDVIAHHRTDGISSWGKRRAEIYRSIRQNFGAMHLGPALLRFKLLELRTWVRHARKTL